MGKKLINTSIQDIYDYNQQRVLIHVELYNVLQVKVCGSIELPILFAEELKKSEGLRLQIPYKELHELNPNEVPKFDKLKEKEKNNWLLNKLVVSFNH